MSKYLNKIWYNIKYFIIQILVTFDIGYYSAANVEKLFNMGIDNIPSDKLDIIKKLLFNTSENLDKKGFKFGVYDSHQYDYFLILYALITNNYNIEKVLLKSKNDLKFNNLDIGIDVNEVLDNYNDIALNDSLKIDNSLYECIINKIRKMEAKQHKTREENNQLKTLIEMVYNFYYEHMSFEDKKLFLTIDRKYISKFVEFMEVLGKYFTSNTEFITKLAHIYFNDISMDSEEFNELEKTLYTDIILKGFLEVDKEYEEWFLEMPLSELYKMLVELDYFESSI